MLSIRSTELDDLRLKLLAAVATGTLADDAADLARIIARDLAGLSVLIGNEGESGIFTPADALGDLLSGLICEKSP
jgi:hypothetical protein